MSMQLDLGTMKSEIAGRRLGGIDADGQALAGGNPNAISYDFSGGATAEQRFDAPGVV